MKSKFLQICESFGVLKTTKRIMYPKRIIFSPKFLDALREEFTNQKLNEDKERPLKEHKEKFLKALGFYLIDFEKNLQPLKETKKPTSQVVKLKAFVKSRGKINNLIDKEKSRIERENISRPITKKG